MQITIKNASKKTIVSQNANIITNILTMTFGLMFAAKPQALIFRFSKEKYVPLHMWFVFFPIDVVFLDKNKRVVEIKKEFKPFSYYNPKQKAQYVVELPTGSVTRSKITLKDLLEF